MGSRSRPVNLIDLGLARRHIDSSSVVRQRRHCPFVGTLKYASHNIHAGLEAGRCDDLISWFYSLIEMLQGRLPWHGVRDRGEVQRAKCDPGAAEVLCKGLPAEIHSIFRCIGQYKYSDEPNYPLLIAFIVQAMKRNHCRWVDKFDWEIHIDPLTLERISVVPLQIPDDDLPDVPKGLPRAVVPGDPIPEKKCCVVQ
jgi:serine/threonine protein kinase